MQPFSSFIFLAIVYNCICIDVLVDLLLMLIKSSNVKKNSYIHILLNTVRTLYNSKSFIKHIFTLTMKKVNTFYKGIPISTNYCVLMNLLQYKTYSP